MNEAARPLALMVPHILDAAQPEVRQRAHHQRQALCRNALDQRRIFERAVAVVDAVDAQHVDRFPDILGPGGRDPQIDKAVEVLTRQVGG